jgi:Bacterial regulatory proteins, tetR family
MKLSSRAHGVAPCSGRTARRYRSSGSSPEDATWYPAVAASSSSGPTVAAARRIRPPPRCNASGRRDGSKSATRTRLPAAERRESILRAAAEAFAESGYRAGKVSDVAARVGVTEPVIFQNFGSKAALFAAVLDRAAADVRAHLDDLIRHAQADGGVRADIDPQTAAWLLLSMLSARGLRGAAMPAGLEPAVTTLALRAFTPRDEPGGRPPG